MKKAFLYLFLTLFLVSCSTTKTSIYTSNLRNKKNAKNTNNSKANKIVANALKFEGVKYKYGGTTKKGMDCSGVVYVSFGQENIQLPRSSRYMANKGTEIPLKKVKKGDLLFFKISRISDKINHVGLITQIKNGQIYFIHSTSSRGVIISSMAEKYWKNTFVKATRVL